MTASAWFAPPLISQLGRYSGFCLLVLLIGCQSASETGSSVEPEKESLPIIEAEVVAVEPAQWPLIIRSQGSLVADEVAVIGTKVAGRVAEVHIELGDHVRAGQPLVVLDRQEFQLQVEQAEAQLSQARSAIGLGEGESVEQLQATDAPPVRQELALWEEAKAKLARAIRLKSDNVIAQVEYDQLEAAERVAEARYASAINSVHEKMALVKVREAELSLARQRLEDAVIRAPFDAMVQQRQVAPGTYLQVGGSIAVLVRTNPLRFRGMMPERHAQRLAVGQLLTLWIESVEQPRAVQITRISPALDPMSRSLLFEAEVNNSEGLLRGGLFAEAEVEIDPEAHALVVPESAVVEFAGTEKVWKVLDGVTHEQEVVIGQRRSTGLEIVAGLAAGDLILRDGSEGRTGKLRSYASGE